MTTRHQTLLEFERGARLRHAHRCIRAGCVPRDINHQEPPRRGVGPIGTKSNLLRAVRRRPNTKYFDCGTIARKGRRFESLARWSLPNHGVVHKSG